MEDSQIIELYFNRDENAISATNTKYRNLCYSIAYNILYNADDTNEAINDTYLGVWNSIPPNRPSILSAFIGKITRNISLNKLRNSNTVKRGNREMSLAFDEISDCLFSNQDVEIEVEAKELSKVINDFLYSISETERNVFICRYWYFDSIKMISAQFKFSKSKVKSMLFRIRNKLKKKLMEESLI